MSNPNFWTTVLNWTFARGYIRIPIVFTIPIVFNKYALHQFEPLFQQWNAGHNQRDIWDRLEGKVALMLEEEAV
ncbi:uncharacterized protein TEOVI_000010800 [Trypanosoma equiperdum]|uniref:Uncharacterized protein n=4 Tax=Trypanozoon TaxID=39700 RepID=Q582B1_TRYB2|nr:hypothetical protein, conserved [Trypanosoma brucei gambiense DAL972]XP_844928.1 hypothetical protein, conserved [Trypanosoma brucei brucei TREU927]AAX80458.1 hypothetical protein, conserved [Trypanosoma brucei]RHW72336.1 hypothetical protein DPX39_050032000 [Trypanosoma brucei equiperdum]SCU64715.1 hypothetical protein, conserved [Trypanosoma equiperdum]AAZ11369.1 hypothetical protein, conserved [Trypanosoma brucei brucei TREU927]CBH11223.1 hypothetical protein, conserved [Trypanosoma bru|eukprot:XP_011773510.1 hypothetical protein, conserved [Trypanosoma brucei gambiense DAL972]